MLHVLRGLVLGVWRILDPHVILDAVASLSMQIELAVTGGGTTATQSKRLSFTIPKR